MEYDVIESEYQKNEYIGERNVKLLGKIAKCIEMQLKIVNDFLTEIYIRVQWTLKLFSFVEINKQINK